MRYGCELWGDEWYFVLDAERDHWDLGNSNMREAEADENGRRL